MNGNCYNTTLIKVNSGFSWSQLEELCQCENLLADATNVGLCEKIKNCLKCVCGEGILSTCGDYVCGTALYDLYCAFSGTAYVPLSCNKFTDASPFYGFSPCCPNGGTMLLDGTCACPEGTVGSQCQIDFGGDIYATTEGTAKASSVK